MKHKRNGLLIRLIGMVTAIAIVFLLSSCGREQNTMSTTVSSHNGFRDVYPQTVVSALHQTEPSKLRYLAKSGLVELYIDEVTFSVTVKETLQGTLWHSLPVNGAEVSKDAGAVFRLTVAAGNDTLHMNSQDNAVAFGNASFLRKADGVIVDYLVTPDEETAKKTDYAADDIAFSVTVDYTLSDGSLFVSCSHTNLSGNPNAKLLNLGLLEFFGAFDKAQEGDFLLVPDGSGALIHAATADVGFEPMRFKVYGEDPGVSDTGAVPAAVGVYGIKRGDSAMAAIINEADALATISAYRANSEGGFHRVGLSFEITPFTITEKGNKTTRHIGINAYEGPVGVCLRFMSDNNASYSGIAAACREQLVRNRVLSTKTVEAGEYLPMNLVLFGGIYKDVFNLGVVRRMQALTTFEQAQDMLSILKSKGVNTVNLRYTGAFTGGLNPTAASRGNVLRILGGSAGLAELHEFMTSQKMELYLDISLFSSSNPAVSLYRAGGKTVAENTITIRFPNNLSSYIGTETFERRLHATEKLDASVLRVLKKFRSTPFAGFSLSDAGRVLYSDFSSSAGNRQEFSELLSEQIRILSTGKKIMIDTGNFYALKNADLVVNMPMGFASGQRERKAYASIPFVPMILHGIVDYSPPALNTAEDYETAKLRAIEYGASPLYAWSYTRLGKLADEDEMFYYDDWLSDAIEYYSQANAALATVRNRRIVRHSEVAPGVFCTEYAGNSFVYVNYSRSDYEVSGFTVKARGFVRIN